MQNIFYSLEQIYKFLYLSVYGITGNYGIALILLSLFIYIVLFPFNRKAQQIQNLEREVQSIIAPQIAEIKKQYHGKEQYEKIQRLYHRYAYHPIYAIRSAAGIILQIPFFVAARSMLYALPDIKGIQWGIIQDLGKPDQLLGGINLLPFVMTFVTILYAFVMPKLTKKEITQTIIIGILFLIILYPAPSALLVFWTCNLLWSLLHCILFERFQWFNDYVERINNYVKDNELAFHIIFALALTVGLLVPMEIYIKNASQLLFGIKDILKYLSAGTFQKFCIIVFIYIVFSYIRNKKIKYVFLSVLFGVLFGVFLQSYILSLDYGMFDGHEIKWEEYTWQGIVNSLIWLVCLGGAFQFFRRLGFDKERIKKIVKPFAFGIVVIQCFVLAYTLKNNPLPENAFMQRKSINVLTTKDMFNISSKENIIIFLLDAFDAKIFEEIIVKEPEIIKELSGFTFYPDTTSVYGYTDYSVPQILTGKEYINDRPYAEYFENAWKETPYYKCLLKNNYDIGIYTAGNLVSKFAPISNLINEQTVLNDDSVQVFKNLVKFRMVPHCLKKYYYDYDPNAWMKQIANKNLQAYQLDDKQFYNDLKNGLICIDNKNCFRFYHLTGAHFPFIFNRNMEMIGLTKKGTQYEQSVGVMKIVLNYIKQMKEKGVFDNSTFVITADHGVHNKVGSRPLLCVKKPKEKSAIKISNESISFSEFMPMVLQELLSIKRDKKLAENSRKYYYLMKNNDLIEYHILGNAKDLNSWKMGETLESYYRRDNNSYKLNKVIDFTIQGNSSKFKVTGWDREEALGTWALGKGAALTLSLGNIRKQNLRLSLIASTYVGDLPLKTVKIFANSYFVGEMSFTAEDKVAGKRWTPLTAFVYKIPSYAIIDGILKIYFHIDQPGASVRYEYGRDLGVFLNRLIIETDS